MIERYQSPQMAEIWDRQAELDRWAEIEIAAMQNNPLAGQAWCALSDGHTSRPSARDVAIREQTTGHEVVAFLQVWGEHLQGRGCSEAARWLHYGLTSSDLVDSGLGLALIDSVRVLHSLCRGLTDQLWAVLHAYAGQRQIGRTHGQWAVPRPAAHPWVVARHTLERIQSRLSEERVGWGKLSGPVGFPPSTNQEMDALLSLGLDPALSTQIVPRDHVSEFAAACADLATFCEGLATQVRLLSIAGVDELHEGRRPGQVGSSAMPHKHNPVVAENICGLARLVRAAEAPLRLGLVQWFDRDLAHSSVERVALPDLCHLTATCLQRSTDLLVGLRIDRLRTQANLDRAMAAGDGFSHDRVMEHQCRGLSYLEAHERTRQELGYHEPADEHSACVVCGGPAGDPSGLCDQHKYDEQVRP